MEGYENHVNLNMLDEDTVLTDENSGERRLKERAEKNWEQSEQG